MALVTSTTNLKSLKYGNDRPRGGSSNQPYIKNEIPNNQSLNYTLNTPDVISRGGPLALIRATQDVSRLTQMFADFKSPAGFLYIDKQNLLSRVSPKTEASEGIGYGGDFFNAGLYTPLSPLLQAMGNIAGLHVNHLGLDPLSPQSGDIFGLDFPSMGLNRYGDVIKENNFTKFNLGEEVSNRLLDLTRVKIYGVERPKINSTVAQDNNEILNYSGGPGSVFGVGNTVIPFASHRVDNKLNIKSSINDSLLPEDVFLSYKLIDGKDRYSTQKEDFRKDVISEEKTSSRLISLSPSYKTKNIENRLFLGDPGKSNTKDNQKDVFRYGLKANDKEMEALDKITSLPIYGGEGVDISKPINDLVKFRIASVDNDKTGGYAQYIHFRAFIDSFDDDYVASYAPTQYVGRGDSFHTYLSFNRTINMSFTVVAQSKAELIPMYKKLNYLASLTAPDYSSSGFMRGNLIRLTLGGYLYEQYGILTGIRYSIPTESPWEIAIDEEGKSDSSVKELPHIIKVTSFSFTPINDFLTQKVKDPSKPNERYISLSNGSGSNYEDVYPNDNQPTPTSTS